MESELLKHCNICGKDLPATTQYFFPSYLKDGSSRDECKECHERSDKRGREIRSDLIETARYIGQNNVLGYQKLRDIAHDIGCSVTKIEREIHARGIPIFKMSYHNSGVILALKDDDAEAYKKSSMKVERQIMGTPDRCGSCGATSGNIIADLDEKTKEARGYLCSKCYRTLSYWKGDPILIRKVADYIEKTWMHSL